MNVRFMRPYIKVGSVYTIFALCLATAYCVSPTFRSPYNISNVLRQAVALGMVSLGQTFVILTGGIDLSTGSLISLTSCLAAGIMAGKDARLLPAVALVLLLGAAAGLGNGLLVSFLRMPPFIVTLGSMSLLQGLVFLYTKGPVGAASPSLYEFADSYLGPLPLPVLVFAVFVVLAHVLLCYHTFGRYVYSTGGSREVTRTSGINVCTVLVAVYGISGLFAACTGLFLVGRMGIGDPLVGQGFEMDSIAATLLGGTALSGGRGGVIGTVAGVMTMALVSNILNMTNVSGFWQWVIKGAILVAAVCMYQGRRRA